jgi:G3E family GTPase
MKGPVSYTIIGGYLGAGKTTLLNRLLHNTASQNAGQRLALLINDFGSINIDASLITHQTDSQINLTNGCICCGLSAGFDEAIETLLGQSPRPDHIIVEASGVADVVSLAQYGLAPGLTLAGVLVVADAETVRAKASDKYVAATVQRQLQGADLILLNKTDLLAPAALTEVESWLRELTPRTPIVLTSHCDVPLEILLGVSSKSAPGPAHTTAQQSSSPHEHHEIYTTWQFEHPTPLTAAAVDAFVDALPDSVLRAKGYFLIDPDQRLLFQRVGARSTLEPSTTTGATELVVIGLADQLSIEALEHCAIVLCQTG